MKNLVYGLTVVSLLWSSSLLAGKKQDALIALFDTLRDDEKCLTVAKRALGNKKNYYQVEWSAEFNFKDKDDDARATRVAHALDSYFNVLISKAFSAKAKIDSKSQQSEYEKANTKYNYLIKSRDKTSDAWSQAFTSALQ